MTAIPEPTEEDFKNLQKLETWHSACVVRMSGKVIADSWQESLGSAVRLLSHYQRENERLERQRDVLHAWLKKHCSREIQIDRLVFVDTEDEMEGADEIARQKETVEFLEVFDALSGEGGAG